MLSDFELAIIQALALNFPNSQHRGCYFHYMQAIWRKVQALGLATNYTDPQDLSLKHFVQKMAAIAFCPPAFVRPAWMSVQQEAPQIARVDELVTYFSNTWVSGNYQVRHARTHTHTHTLTCEFGSLLLCAERKATDMKYSSKER